MRLSLVQLYWRYQLLVSLGKEARATALLKGWLKRYEGGD